MAPPVITVTRQYGSGGSDIARLVAERLGWELVDNQFVEEVARRAGVPPDEVAQREERAPGLLERLARTLAGASPEMFIAQAAVPRVEQDEATLVKVTERVIAEAAMHGRVVLVGRGAQAVLGNRPDALHAYVVASKAFRMKLAVERLGADPAHVERVVDETDRQRDQYVKTYYGRHRHEVTNYDLVVNAEKLGFEGAAGLIVPEARRRGWRKRGTRKWERGTATPTRSAFRVPTSALGRPQLRHPPRCRQHDQRTDEPAHRHGGRSAGVLGEHPRPERAQPPPADAPEREEPPHPTPAPDR